ncbi:uronate isomerase [Arenicella chitinivorans]|uniref:Uronate isomerase n=1 Tax=Arenicella chitinivorans TaxID=1329800 RepID=A0A918RG82_9GAMM|nr:glucuronate isomerase [Arenicella chitinivorans]GGZ97584.1 uronate isomerase [Arenicella chitinivorans]
MTTNKHSLLDPNRLFPADSASREIAIQLYNTIKDRPIISPHGHTDPSWFANNECFTDATKLLLVPDHYLFRMLYSQGISMSSLGVPRVDGGAVETDMRKIWHCLAENYHLFRGTPSSMWMDHVFYEVFGLNELFSPATADSFYDHISAQLQTDAYRPRALLDRFNIELIATTEGAIDELPHHRAIAGTEWAKRVITTFRPDDAIDPSREDFIDNVARLGELTGEDTTTWTGYLDAMRARRATFREHGATATDHGHPTAATADLSRSECEALFSKCLSGHSTAAEQELFRAQMLTEMAGMSLEDGMVMQIHAGARRNVNQQVFEQFGRDKGADVPSSTNYLDGLIPLLNKYGNETKLNIILFTLDETTYSRELAPLAGHFPCLKLGPPWWFHDSPEGMLRFRQQATESAGFYNTVGFNDDTRAFLSIPARHDVARRMDCRFLATLVAEGRLRLHEAEELAPALAYDFAKQGYKLS